MSVVHFDLLDSALSNISFPLLYFMTSSQTSLAVDNCLTGCLPGILKVGSIGILIYSSLGCPSILIFLSLIHSVVNQTFILAFTSK